MAKTRYMRIVIVVAFLGILIFGILLGYESGRSDALRNGAYNLHCYGVETTSSGSTEYESHIAIAVPDILEGDQKDLHKVLSLCSVKISSNRSVDIVSAVVVSPYGEILLCRQSTGKCESTTEE